MIETINRDALILFPKQPLYDWVNYVSPDYKMKCPKPLAHDEGEVYLIPEFDHPDETIEFLKDYFIEVFEHQLFSWVTDERLWPEALTWELFNSWFHYSIQSMVLDTLDEEIEKDDF